MSSVALHRGERKGKSRKRGGAWKMFEEGIAAKGGGTLIRNESLKK